MARPKAFDRDEALARAVQVFADYGYQGTSTEMLLEAMGLSRQSLYDTFGAKRDLYLEALQRYNLQSAERVLRDLERGKSPLDSLKRALLSFVDTDCALPNAACLGISAVCEFGRRDEAVTSAQAASSAVMARPIYKAFERAKAAGEIRADVDPHTATELFFCLLSGLKVSARAGTAPARLRKMASLALQAFV